MPTFLAKANAGKLDFGSEYNSSRFNIFLKENPNLLIEIKPRSNPVSSEMRGYLFGAVIPFLRQIDTEAWSEVSDEQIYEILKKNFNYFEAENPVTKRKERFAQSVMNTSCKNIKAMEFIMRIGDWVYTNYGQHLPSPEEYKAWRDSAPMEEFKSKTLQK